MGEDIYLSVKVPSIPWGPPFYFLISMKKVQFHQLIAAGQIEAAIQGMITVVEVASPRLHVEALKLSARYQEYKRAQRNNLESPAELSRRLNQITDTLLEIVKDLPEDFSVSDKSASKIKKDWRARKPAMTSEIESDKQPQFDLNAVFWFSMATFAVLLAISLAVPGWTQRNNVIFRTLLALAAAGVGATFPVLLNLKIKGLGKTVSALAFGMMAFFLNPAKEEISTALTIQMRPLPPSSQYPAFKNLELEIWNKNEWLKGKFSEEGVADFKNLSPEIIGKTVALRWKAEYYLPAKDSLTIMPPSVTLEFVPDGSLGQISGTVQDSKGNFLAGVIVRAEGNAITTDSSGAFNILIPPEQQKAKYRLIAAKPGYKTWENFFSPMAGQEAPIVLAKNKN